MNAKRAFWWLLGKYLLAAAILIFVVIRFAQDLARLDPSELTLRPGWLIASLLLYLLGLSCSGLFWYRLLWTFGERPTFLKAMRAYFVGHLGKYLPGKALSLLIRGSLICSPQVKLGVAMLSASYEVFTTMASGALLAALLFTLNPPTVAGLHWNPVFVGLCLLGLVGVPLLPAVFNRLVQGLARRFEKVASFRLPRLRIGTLLLGLAMTSISWFLLGLSLWALLQAILPHQQPPLSLPLWGRYTAMMSLAYVAGFLALVMPSGVGVREYFLLRLLPAELSGAPAALEPLVAMAVIVLRLVWTAGELLLAAVLYWWPGTEKPVVPGIQPVLVEAALVPQANVSDTQQQ